MKTLIAAFTLLAASAWSAPAGKSQALQPDYIEPLDTERYVKCLQGLAAQDVEPKARRTQKVKLLRERIDAAAAYYEQLFPISPPSEEILAAGKEKGKEASFRNALARSYAASLPQAMSAYEKNLLHVIKQLRDLCGGLAPEGDDKIDRWERKFQNHIDVNEDGAMTERVQKDIREKMADELFNPPQGPPFPWDDAAKAHKRISGFVYAAIVYHRNAWVPQKDYTKRKKGEGAPRGGGKPKGSH